MAPDGKSFVTAVGSQDHTVWLHDKDGDHQISSEGDASTPKFSSDGRRLYFLMANGQTHGAELWIKDLSSGTVDRVLPGYPMNGFSVSQDGKEVAFAVIDQSGHSNLWIAPTNHRSSPVRISSAAVEDSPLFLPAGDLIFRAIEGGSNFLYRMKIDGTDRHKISSERILDILAVSPDGRWVTAGTANPDDEHTTVTKAYPVEGGAAVPLCVDYCTLSWDTAGRYAFLSFLPEADGSYAVPVMHDSGLPKLPSVGLAHSKDFKNTKTSVVIPWYVQSSVNPSVYAYSREMTRRNLYRIQLP